MNDLVNIKDFDTYMDYMLLKESLTDGSQSACNKAFINGGPIQFADGSSVNPRDIVKVVNEAIHYLADQYTRTFKFATRINIIYLRYSKKIKTMAVDEHMNLYMNASFIYHTLKMDKLLIGAVIMHEVFHVLFNHIERGKNWLSAKGKASNEQTHHDTNIAADIEVNQSLVRLEIIDKDTLVNTINGLYLENVNGSGGSRTNVVPMEIILDNEDYMNKLREMCPPPVDPENQKQKDVIKTTGEWDKGYKDGWNKIAGLIKKYGYKKAWEKLQEAGIVTGEGEFDPTKKIDDIMAVECLQIKKCDEFINESNEKNELEKGQTYDNGFFIGASKLIDRLKNAMNPSGDGGDGGDDGENNGGNKYESNLNKDDLEKVDIPQKGGKKSKSENDGCPENIDSSNDGDGEGEDGDGNDSGDDNNESDNNNSNDSNGSNKSNNEKGGKGGSGKSDDEITDDDLNKLSDDLKNNGSGKSDEQQSSGNDSGDDDFGAIGGTGSYINSKDITNDDLKDSGYTQEDIDEINEVRKRNAERNTQKGIEKARDDMRRNLSNNDPVKKYLDAIDVESEKYKNVWKKIMEDFLAKYTRRAGTMVNDTSINWKRKSRIALGNVGPQYQKVDQDPQDVNVYVDVSGSVNEKLLEIICKSLVIFTQEYEYSGINICPWASYSNGIHAVDDFRDRSEEEVTQEILKIVSKGIAQCGGGTEAKAVLAAMVDCVVNTLENEDKEQKDDVHVVITDGQFDYENIENKIFGAVKNATGRSDVASLAPEHTFWMIYDASERLMDEWKSEIKKGKLIFINSNVVIGNG